MRALSTVCGFMLVLIATNLPAKPLISANKTVHEVDTVVEGTRDAVSYTFKIRNTGDEVLTIRAVRPG
jgi:hypothetical protein